MKITKGKGKNIKKRASNHTANRPSAEEEESSKQLEEEREENLQTGTANEPGSKQGTGRPRLPLLSAEAMEIRREGKRQRDRDYRANKKKREELFMKFCDEKGITEELEAFLEKHEEEEEQRREYCEELGMVSEALEDGAKQQFDKEIEMILKNFSENPWTTLEESRGSGMIQTAGVEGVTATNSSSLGARGTIFERVREFKRKREEELDRAHRGKRPATAYATPSHPRIGGLMAEAHQNHGQSVAALATQGPLLSTDKGAQIQMRRATHDREPSTSSCAPPPHHDLGLGSKQEVSMYDLVKQYVKLKDAKRRQEEAAAACVHADCKLKEKKKEVGNLNKQVKGEEEVYNKLKAELAEKNKISKDARELETINAVTLGWNLMKGLLQSMQPGSEFLDLPLLDAIQRYESLQNQFNEGLTLIGQGHPIDDKVAMQSDNPPVVVPRSFFWLYEWLERDMELESNVFAPQGDAANIAANGPQFQAANARANNVEQEDDANDQRMDEATEADRCVSMWLRDPDGGEDA
ncbi:hypothetical protein SLEP1_g29664 [Rubroshorea leprosula]|uniref:Uncharacterized protein n=1 Tax=Rubroshorea leprosula TaxID=152421 RepID=A0AAV5K865_9ROSI|nr:hypothetical protein SLEP1_g29664 [Rubroshorea leprosula]